MLIHEFCPRVVSPLFFLMNGERFQIYFSIRFHTKSVTFSSRNNLKAAFLCGQQALSKNL